MGEQQAATHLRCSSRSFTALMATVFLGALNDNLYKLTISYLALSKIESLDNQARFMSLVGLVFALPFIVGSPQSGLIADRFSKAKIMRVTRWLDLGIMLIGGYALVSTNLYLSIAVLFCMALQSTIFSPCKYGILPEMLREDEISRGNGFNELFTFVAIVVGTATSGILSYLFPNTYMPHALIVVGISVLGIITSHNIRATRSGDPCVNVMANPLKQVIQDLREIHSNRGLWLSMLAIAFFWFYGSFFQTNILLYAKESAGLLELGTSVLLCLLAVSIGLGSAFAGKVSRGRVELGLVPIGALGIFLYSVLLGFSEHSHILMGVCVAGLGFSSGAYIVPLNAFFQKTTPVENRGRLLAASNVVSFSSMLLASGFVLLLGSGLGIKPDTQFIISGIIALGASAIIVAKLPIMLMRCINWLCANLFYSLKVRGLENIPETGPAVLVCNHVSYVDPFIIASALEREIRFVMHRSFYEKWWIKPVAKFIRAIPIASEDSPKDLLRSLRVAKDELKKGEILCLFAEGQLSRIGRMLPFGRGIELIVKGQDVPVIPMYLDQIWGSIFSFKHGRFFLKRPEAIPHPITLAIGTPMRTPIEVRDLRQAVQELSADAFAHRKRKYNLLHLEFIRQAKKRTLRTCMANSSGEEVSYHKALTAAFALSIAFKRLIGKTEANVGILLPPCIGAALANLGLLCGGYVPVNLNYTVGDKAREAASQKAGIETIVTSKAFLDKLGIEVTQKTILLEDLIAEQSQAKMRLLYLSLLLCPTFLLTHMVSNKGLGKDSLATIIFSSGSTGEPKGVMLSHGNVQSNVESFVDILDIKRTDAILSVLPLFHSFGFTVGFWLPLIGGIKAVFHTNPLDAATIGELAQKHKLSLMITAPTFLLSYVRKCTPEEFAHLRLVVTGAEKLTDRLANAFEKKFGILPMEGYGCTELSPVAMVNMPGYIRDDIQQVGHKLGTVGHPIPGVAVKIVNPDSFEPIEIGENGLLLVRGPNVMLGYLGEDEKTKQVIKDGWYVTGDLASVDLDGFVTIHDRLSRFSKIGGEMVPHLSVEHALQEYLGTAERVCVVTGVPDEKKGERLVVITTVEMNDKEARDALSEAGLPNLWIPREGAFFRVEEIPLLGSGKLDLSGIKKLAQELSV